MPRPIRVLVVDDSAVVRRLVTDALRADPEIEVVGTATDPYVAKTRIEELNPDILTLDIEMPRMDGLTFLGILMRERPMPVVVMSSLTKEGSHQALDALRLGAVEVIAKPGGPYSFGRLGPQLIHAIKAGAHARVFARPAPAPASALGSAHATPRSAPQPVSLAKIPAPQTTVHDPRRIILLGASTGGTEALRAVLTRLPAGLPPIAIVQHIPATFSRAFAERLDSLCSFPVAEAIDGQSLAPGTALVAPGDFHLLLQWTGNGYRVALNSGAQVWHQRPAVDVLFRSLPAPCRAHAIAGVLTGMGRDGASGLLQLRQAGARTFAQDEASSVVYGMPREAWEQGGAERQVPLDAVADHLVRLTQTPPSPRAHS